VAFKRQIQSKWRYRSFTDPTARQGQEDTLMWKYESGQKTKYFKPSAWETDGFVLLATSFIRSLSFGWSEENDW